MFASSRGLWLLVVLFLGGIAYGWYRYEFDSACRRRCAGVPGSRFVSHKVKQDGAAPTCYCLDTFDEQFPQADVTVF